MLDEHLDLLRILQQHPPARQRRRDAHAEKAQRALAQDHPGNGEAGDHDQMAQSARNQVAEDDAAQAGARHLGGGDEVLAAILQHLAAHHPRQPPPVDDRQDDDDEQIAVPGGHAQRHGGSQRQPQRQRRQRDQHFDDALDVVVHAPGEIARDHAHDGADQDGQEGAHEGHRQAHLRAAKHPRVEVAAQGVGAPEIPAPAFADAHEAHAARNDPQDPVWLAAPEEQDGVALLAVLRVGDPERFAVTRLEQVVDVRARQTAAVGVAEVDALRRREQVLGGLLAVVHGAEERRQQRHQQQECDHDAGAARQPVPAEPAPDQLPDGASDEVLRSLCNYRAVNCHAVTRSGCADRTRPGRCPPEGCRSAETRPAP